MWLYVLFYTITNLQGSQTQTTLYFLILEFYTITNLQGSQTYNQKWFCIISFTPLQTYKVLKRTVLASKHGLGFYTITNLQGSQTTLILSYIHLLFYTITNLQGSQTRLAVKARGSGFTPLQTYKVLKPQMRLSPSQTYWLICVSYLVMYKTHVFIY